MLDGACGLAIAVVTMVDEAMTATVAARIAMTRKLVSLWVDFTDCLLIGLDVLSAKN